jgi:hypothetical protein
MSKTLIAALVAGAAVSAANADIVASWNLQGTANGNNASASGSGVAGQTSATNITRGAGLTALGTPANNGFSADGWTGQATDFISFGFTVNAGYSVNLTSLLIGSRSSNTGPGSLGLYYSGDSFASNLFTFVQSPGSNFVNSNIALALSGLTGVVEFRIRAIGTTSANGGSTGSNGTFRLTNYFAATVDSGSLSFNGTVIPAPGALALVGLGGLVAGRRRR